MKFSKVFLVLSMMMLLFGLEAMVHFRRGIQFLKKPQIQTSRGFHSFSPQKNGAIVLQNNATRKTKDSVLQSVYNSATRGATEGEKNAAINKFFELGGTYKDMKRFSQGTANNFEFRNQGQVNPEEALKAVMELLKSKVTISPHLTAKQKQGILKELERKMKQREEKIRNGRMSNPPTFLEKLDILLSAWRLRHLPLLEKNRLHPVIPKILRAIDLIPQATAITGLAAGGYIYNKHLEKESENAQLMQQQIEATQEAELEKLIEEGLKEITQQTDDNNNQITVLQSRLTTEKSTLTTTEQAAIQQQIEDLKIQNMNLEEQANNLQNEVNENMQEYDPGITMPPLSRYGKLKNFIYDSPIYINRFGNYLGNTFLSIWNGFTTMTIKDQANLLIQGMRSMASSAVKAPKDGVKNLQNAFAALLRKENRTTTNPTPIQ